MIHWGKGTVSKIIRCDGVVQEVMVKLGSEETCRAVNYMDILSPLNVGDEVLLNTTAMDLNLGTGGVHFVYDKLRTEPIPQVFVDDDRVAETSEAAEAAAAPDAVDINLKNTDAGGHIMKLRYTPLQKKVLSVEEPESPHHADFLNKQTLEGMPVLVGELHSMLPAIISLIHAERPQTAEQTAYIMSDGGALPISFSRHVAHLTALGWLRGTITYGQAYGGTLEAVNKFTALLAARHIFRAQAAIVTMGPGNAGTGTAYGFSGMETGEIVNAIQVLGGQPVFVPRISFADQRERHRGLSHHTLTALGTAAISAAVVPIPDGLEEAKQQRIEQQLQQSRLADRHQIVRIRGLQLPYIKQAFDRYPEKISTMGRGVAEDSDFFLGVAAAVRFIMEEMGE